MAHEMGPKPDANRLRDCLLGQWEPSRPTYLTYRKEVETMLAIQEKALLREKRFAGRKGHAPRASVFLGGEDVHNHNPFRAKRF